MSMPVDLQFTGELLRSGLWGCSPECLAALQCGINAKLSQRHWQLAPFRKPTYRHSPERKDRKMNFQRALVGFPWKVEPQEPK